MRGKPDQRRDPVRRERIIPAHAGQTRVVRAAAGQGPDHPRACGANGWVSWLLATARGSSPRMRGKPQPLGNLRRKPRIIPAHAGQTRTGGGGRLGKPDHPRACGANNGYVSGYGPLDGSSPRMRGKRPEHRGPNGRGRIIPAHAGQTPPSAPSCRRRPDHPRACGANSIRHPFAVTALGSSPRMRGKQRPVAPKRVAVRIIPAHAGQTDLPYGRAIESTDHPRACGANAHQRGGQHAQTGSSPRMRGKLFGTPDTWNHPRIIPAHAGQTHRQTIRDSSRADHPRACGANQLRQSRYSPPGGSSPRMRGKRFVPWDTQPILRIIPAHAGQTRNACMNGPAFSDHPRACGANSGSRLPSTSTSGSSPRMRGKLTCCVILQM